MIIGLRCRECGGESFVQLKPEVFDANLDEIAAMVKGYVCSLCVLKAFIEKLETIPPQALGEEKGKRN